MKYAILIYISFSPLALAGNELGNGGDGFAQDFVATGRGMVAELRDNPDPRISDFAAFEKAVSNTHVASTTDPLLLDGQEVDAINYPHEGRITMSRPHWGALSAEKRRALVLHEYLGICCDRSDRNYEISSSYTTDDIPAAVISPIGELACATSKHTLSGGRVGELTQRLFDEITAIQYGEKPDTFGWTEELK